MVSLNRISRLVYSKDSDIVIVVPKLLVRPILQWLKRFILLTKTRILNLEVYVGVDYTLNHRAIHVSLVETSGLEYR